MMKLLFDLAVGVAVVYRLYQLLRWKLCKLDYAGKIVFITGGSSGIGEALTKKLATLGCKKIIIAARRQNELDRVKSECCKPELIETFLLDLNKPEECLVKCQELFGREQVDIVINNGGISQRDLFEDMSFMNCPQLMDVNCMAPIAICKAVLPSMMARKSG